MATFVLVPGAWLGGWAWEDTAQALRERGHKALPLTLTGLGEYTDRGTPETDLEAHIADITDFVERRDLRDITLVAHSYEDKRELLRARATPQPFGTYEQRLIGPVEPSPDVDRVLVVCNDFKNLLDAGVPMLAFLNQPPWRRFDLSTGHWPMLSAPAELAGVLDAAVS